MSDLPPVVAFTNALRRLYIRRASALIARRQTELAALTAQQQCLTRSVVTTTTTPAPADVAELLGTAETHMERVGHNKGWLYDETRADAGEALAEIPVCSVGAVLAAAYGQPRYPSIYPEHSDLVDAAISALCNTVGQPIHVWNDAKGRQKRQVLKAFRDTAAGLKAVAA